MSNPADVGAAAEGLLPEPGGDAPAGRYARTGEARQILVDPEVSRAKFERELNGYHMLAADRRKVGWLMLRAEYPEVLVAFAAPRLRPVAVLFGALLDFTNYDLWAPSVTIVNPFNEQPLRYRDIPQDLRMLRGIQQVVEVPNMGALPGEIAQPLLQALQPDEVPFLCIPGVREYHDHPAHSGDQWLLHRGRGEGTLFFLLEKLYQYGVEPLNGYQFGLSIAGFTRSGLPA